MNSFVHAKVCYISYFLNSYVIFFQSYYLCQRYVSFPLKTAIGLHLCFVSVFCCNLQKRQQFAYSFGFLS